MESHSNDGSPDRQNWQRWDENPGDAESEKTPSLANGIPWDDLLAYLQSVEPDWEEWSRAEEFAKAVIALAERNREAAGKVHQLQETLESVRSHTNLLPYFEIAGRGRMGRLRFQQNDRQATIEDLTEVQNLLEASQELRDSGSITARQDSDTQIKIDIVYKRARARRKSPATTSSAATDQTEPAEPQIEAQRVTEEPTLPPEAEPTAEENIVEKLPPSQHSKNHPPH